jgi:hypothetical protein
MRTAIFLPQLSPLVVRTTLFVPTQCGPAPLLKCPVELIVGGQFELVFAKNKNTRCNDSGYFCH